MNFKVLLSILFISTLAFANTQMTDMPVAPTIDAVWPAQEWIGSQGTSIIPAMTYIGATGCEPGGPFCELYALFSIPYSQFNEGNVEVSFMIDDEHNKGARPQLDDIKCEIKDAEMNAQLEINTFHAYRGNGITWVEAGIGCVAKGKKTLNPNDGQWYLIVEMNIHSTGGTVSKGAMLEIKDGATTFNFPNAGPAPDNWETLEFQVAPAPESNANIGLGAKDPGSHSWNIGTDPINELSLLKVIATQTYGIDMQSVKIKGVGTGDETKLHTVKLYNDNGDFGELSPADILLDTKTFSQDNGEITLSFQQHKVPVGQVKYYLVVYEMGTHDAGDTFSFQVTNVVGRKDTDNSIVTFNGIPFNSGTKTVLGVGEEPPVPLGMGAALLTLNPTSGIPGAVVTATVSGLTAETEGKMAYVKQYSCVGPKVVECLITSQGKCSGTFSSQPYNGMYAYYGCIDLDNDGKYNSAGEQSHKLLTLSSTAAYDYCYYPNCGGCLLEEECIEHTSCEWNDDADEEYCGLKAAATPERVIREIVSGGEQVIDGEEPDITLYIILGAIATLLLVIAVSLIGNMFKKGV